MNWQTTKPTALLMTVLLLALTTSLVIACGPSSQYNVEKEQLNGATNLPQEGEPTPVPEPVVNNYPNLDETLQDLVRRYETGELTERKAAALAPQNRGAHVLVQVDLQTEDRNDPSVNTLDKWMGANEIDPRFVNLNTALPLHIYAYPKVSVLGALSQQPGLTLVQALDHPFGENFAGSIPSAEPEGNATRADGGDPYLPLWLKGYPYPNMSAIAATIYAYEHGQMTELEAAEKINRGRNRGNIVGLCLDLASGGASTSDFVRWLESINVEPTLVHIAALGGDSVCAGFPVSLLDDVSRQEGVTGVQLGFDGAPGPKGGPRGLPYQGIQESEGGPALHQKPANIKTFDAMGGFAQKRRLAQKVGILHKKSVHP